MLREAPPRFLQAGAVAAAAVLGLAGCSGVDVQSAADQSQEPATSPPSETAEADQPAEAGVETEVTGTVPDVGEPVATRSIQQEGNAYRLDAFPLVAEEGSPGVSVNIRLVFEKMSTPAVRPGLLASIEDQGSVRVRRASGLQIIDRAGGMAYLPARDAEGVPLCSPEVPHQASTGDQLYVTCVFGGIPEDVESLDLVVPNFGTFRDVPFE